MKYPLILACALSVAVALHTDARHARHINAACSMEPGRTMAVLRVEKDTLLPYVSHDVRVLSRTVTPTNPHDSLLAVNGTPMPGGRVTLLRVDSTTQRVLAQHGITASNPQAFLLAAPYGSDCRAVRYTSRDPFLVRGEIGYIRGSLASRERWIGNVPLIVVSDVWDYPYPRRRSMAFEADSNAILASPEAVFSFYTTVPVPEEWRYRSAPQESIADSIERDRAILWARTNAEAAELQPLRTAIRQSVLAPDWKVARKTSSRLRGSYRLSIDGSRASGVWYFRTEPAPRFNWRALDLARPTADLIASPYIAGYQVTGLGAATYDSLPSVSLRDAPRESRVWLSSSDRLTAPGGSTHRMLAGELQFVLAPAPEALWEDLVAAVPTLSRMDSLFFVRTNRAITALQRQPRIPLTIRIGNGGEVTADTTIMRGNQILRVRLERIDTIALRKP